MYHSLSLLNHTDAFTDDTLMLPKPGDCCLLDWPALIGPEHRFKAHALSVLRSWVNTGVVCVILGQKTPEAMRALLAAEEGNAPCLKKMELIGSLETTEQWDHAKDQWLLHQGAKQTSVFVMSPSERVMWHSVTQQQWSLKHEQADDQLVFTHLKEKRFGFAHPIALLNEQGQNWWLEIVQSGVAMLEEDVTRLCQAHPFLVRPLMGFTSQQLPELTQQPPQPVPSLLMSMDAVHQRRLLKKQHQQQKQKENTSISAFPSN